MRTSLSSPQEKALSYVSATQILEMCSKKSKQVWECFLGTVHPVVFQGSGSILMMLWGPYSKSGIEPQLSVCMSSVSTLLWPSVWSTDGG